MKILKYKSNLSSLIQILVVLDEIFITNWIKIYLLSIIIELWFQKVLFVGFIMNV